MSKPPVVLTERRRKVLREIVENYKFTSLSDLRRILKEEYGIDASIATIGSDLSKIMDADESEVESFKNKVLDRCYSYLRDLDAIVQTAVDDMVRMKAIKVFFQCSKDMAQIVSVFSNREEEEKVSIHSGRRKLKKGEEVKIKFV